MKSSSKEVSNSFEKLPWRAKIHHLKGQINGMDDYLNHFLEGNPEFKKTPKFIQLKKLFEMIRVENENDFREFKSTEPTTEENIKRNEVYKKLFQATNTQFKECISSVPEDKIFLEEDTRTDLDNALFCLSEAQKHFDPSMQQPPQPIKDLIEGSMAVHQGQFSLIGAQIDLKLDHRLKDAIVKGEQVLNLTHSLTICIDNAVKALKMEKEKCTEKGNNVYKGKLTISAGLTINDNVQISIEDNAGGMPKNLLSAVKNGISVTTGGNGIGLPFCYEQVKKSGGKWNVISPTEKQYPGTKIIMQYPETYLLKSCPNKDVTVVMENKVGGQSLFPNLTFKALAFPSELKELSENEKSKIALIGFDLNLIDQTGDHKEGINEVLEFYQSLPQESLPYFFIHSGNDVMRPTDAQQLAIFEKAYLGIIPKGIKEEKGSLKSVFTKFLTAASINLKPEDKYVVYFLDDCPFARRIFTRCFTEITESNKKAKKNSKKEPMLAVSIGDFAPITSTSVPHTENPEVQPPKQTPLQSSIGLHTTPVSDSAASSSPKAPASLPPLDMSRTSTSRQSSSNSHLSTSEAMRAFTETQIPPNQPKVSPKEKQTTSSSSQVSLPSLDIRVPTLTAADEKQQTPALGIISKEEQASLPAQNVRASSPSCSEKNQQLGKLHNPRHSLLPTLNLSASNTSLPKEQQDHDKGQRKNGKNQLSFPTISDYEQKDPPTAEKSKKGVNRF